jgi:hypothetical protein
MLPEALQSPFILNQIKVTDWSNRQFIKELLLLHQLMHKQKLSPAEGQHYFVLRNRYKESYLHLLKETDPVRYQVFLEEQEQLRQQSELATLTEALLQQQLVEAERKEYQAWLAFQNRA